jgi:hypothetical protein
MEDNQMDSNFSTNNIVLNCEIMLFYFLNKNYLANDYELNMVSMRFQVLIIYLCNLVFIHMKVASIFMKI